MRNLLICACALSISSLVSCSSGNQVLESAESSEAVAVKKASEAGKAAPKAKAKAAPKRKLIAGKYHIRSTQRGKMSWYSVKTNGGTKTASGERFTDNGRTAAHRKLSFGTKVRVTNLRNGKSEIVRITDRGPFIKGRIIDVSIGTARRLGFVKNGVVKCKVDILKKA